jgi:hypothetical protein
MKLLLLASLLAALLLTPSFSFADEYAFTFSSDPVGCTWTGSCSIATSGSGVIETTSPGLNPLGQPFAEQQYAADFAAGPVSVITSLTGNFNGSAMSFVFNSGLFAALMPDNTPVRFVPVTFTAAGQSWQLWQNEGPYPPGTEFYLTGQALPQGTVAAVSLAVVAVPEPATTAIALASLMLLLAALTLERFHPIHLR